MKTYGRILLIIVLSIGATDSRAQFLWTKFARNPVLSPGVPGEFDATGIWGSSVIRVNDTLKIWYAGYSDIGYAWSIDGIDWQKYANNPVLLAGPDDWESYYVDSPTVLYKDSLYHMWYMGDDSDGISSTGYATSVDGIHWVKDTLNPVLTGSSAGNFDHAEAIGQGVVWNGTEYIMLYAGGTAAYGPWNTGLATSSDGIIWTRDSLNNPVIDTPLSSWPHELFRSDDEYECFFGEASTGNPIYYATSENCQNWYVHPQPVLEHGETGEWDSATLYYASMLHDSDNPLYHCWYMGRSSTNSQFKLGYASSLQGFQNWVIPDLAYSEPDQEVTLSMSFSEGPQDVELFAHISANYQSVTDSVLLHDDGLHNDGFAMDGVYANTILMPDLESYYWIDLTAYMDGAELIRYPQLGQITTVGPIIIDVEQIEPADGDVGAGDTLFFDLHLENQGILAFVEDVTISITPSDSNSFTISGYDSLACGAIMPESTVNFTGLALQVAEDVEDGLDISFNVKIYSRGLLCWEYENFLLGTVGLNEKPQFQPQDFTLKQNYPNPFNPSTTISYSLPEQSRVSLRVFDIRGKLVAQLKDEVKASGMYEHQWDGIDKSGNQVSTGVYFCRLETGERSQTIKMVLMR